MTDAERRELRDLLADLRRMCDRLECLLDRWHAESEEDRA